jgi:hypothetical protein
MRPSPAAVITRVAATQAAEAKIRLVALVQESLTRRGVDCSNDEREEIMEAIGDLRDVAAGSTTNGSYASATWELLWTTEKVTVRRRRA